MLCLLLVNDYFLEFLLFLLCVVHFTMYVDLHDTFKHDFIHMYHAGCTQYNIMSVTCGRLVWFPPPIKLTNTIALIYC
jgi:hypothetical protein